MYCRQNSQDLEQYLFCWSQPLTCVLIVVLLVLPSSCPLMLTVLLKCLLAYCALQCHPAQCKFSWQQMCSDGHPSIHFFACLWCETCSIAAQLLILMWCDSATNKDEVIWALGFKSLLSGCVMAILQDVAGHIKYAPVQRSAKACIRVSKQTLQQSAQVRSQISIWMYFIIMCLAKSVRGVPPLQI